MTEDQRIMEFPFIVFAVSRATSEITVIARFRYEHMAKAYLNMALVDPFHAQLGLPNFHNFGMIKV